MLRRWTVRTLLEVLLLGAALTCGLTSLSAQNARSSAEDRQRLITITRNLEKTPLESSLEAERAWAMNWLMEAPDIEVAICDDPLGGLAGSGYEHADAILAQYIFAMGTAIIEHPEISNDKVAQQMAGVESALASYRSILKYRPQARSPALDRVLSAQNSGELSNFVRKAYARCIANTKGAPR